MSTYIKVYFIYMAICVCFSILCAYVRVSKKQMAVVLGLLVISNGFIVAFRPLEAADTIEYINVYQRSFSIIQNYHINSFVDFFFNRNYHSMEIGFLYLMYVFYKLGFSVEFFFFSISVIMSVATLTGVYYIVKYCIGVTEVSSVPYSKIIILWEIYMLWEGILYTSVAVRSGIALGISLLALGLFLEKKKRVVSIILFAFSITIHSTAISFLIILAVFIWGTSKLTKQIFTIAWIALVIGYMFRVGDYTVKFALLITNWIFGMLKINAFSSYFLDIEFAFQKREFFLLVLIGMIVIYIYRNDKIFSKLSIIVLIGLAIYTFAYPIHAISREADLFTVFLLPMVMYTEVVCEKKQNIILQILLVMLLIPQYIMIFVQN